MTEPFWKFKNFISESSVIKYNTHQQYLLSFNQNCIWFLYKNPILINWIALSRNANAIELLSKN